jgi:hypothetical protein
MPGLDLGGPLKADTSRGNTKVFLNGRELTQAEVTTLQQLGPVNPGAIESTRRASVVTKAVHRSSTWRCSLRNGTKNTIARPPAGTSGAMKIARTISIPRVAAAS